MATIAGRTARTLAVLALLAIVVPMTPGTAVAAEAAPFDAALENVVSFDVAYTVDRDGSMVVTENLEYEFGAVPRHGIQRDLVVKQRYDDAHDRLYPLQVLSVEASAGTPNQWRILDQPGGKKRIRVGDPDKTITGRHRYVLRYRMRGVLNGFEEHSELYWNVTGNEWVVPISATTLRVTTPAPVTAARCFIGPRGSVLSCDAAAKSGATATFRNGRLLPGAGLTIVAGFDTTGGPTPRPILRERWTPERAFSAAPAYLTGALALFLAAIGAVAVLAWSHGRDRRVAGSAIDMAFAEEGAAEERVRPFTDRAGPMQFEPPDGIRPGQLGTLVDERANPIDVTATIVDLAARGYLTIEEVPPHGFLGKTDWTLTRNKDPRDLLPYERTLFYGLFDNRDSVRLSVLRNHFANQLNKVRNQLYADVVERRWFVRRPDRVRAFWYVMGAVALVLAGGLAFLLAWKTHAGLIGIAAVLGALALLLSARWMPRRTAKGTATLVRAMGFRRFMVESDPERERFAERANLFTEYLPYAVVFGVTEKWARAFAGLDGQVPAPSWYVSTYAFSVDGFAHAIDGFTVSSAGTLTSTPGGSGASGFSGGSSGGGGGGGGGGSW